MSWLDESGAANLVLRSGLVVVRDGDGRPPLSTGGGRWARSTIAVAEAVLSGVEPRVDTIQQATGLSRGATAKALALLEHEGPLRHAAARGPGSARRVVDAGGLLDRYAAAVAAIADKTPVVRLHRLWDDPLDALTREIAPALTKAQVPWAATGVAASLLIAPHLSNLAVVELYVDASLAADGAGLAELLDARVVDRGHRIEIRALPSPVTAAAGPMVDGVRCAPAARVYADLAAQGGRSAEAAQHPREAVSDVRAGA